MNYQASNPERLSETKTRSGSAAKKREAEVLTSCTNLTAARSCMTVAKLLILRGHLQEVNEVQFQTLYQSLPALRSSERDSLVLRPLYVRGAHFLPRRTKGLL